MLAQTGVPSVLHSEWLRECLGRLEDKSSIVRRAALQLLTALLLYNPFGAQLPETCFAASLAEYQAKLQVILCSP